MLHETVPMTFHIEFWIVGESELDGSAYDMLGVKVTIGLRNNLSIDAARGAGSRCTMVFYGFLHHLDLFWGEPALQTHISLQNLATGDMMNGSRT